MPGERVRWQRAPHLYRSSSSSHARSHTHRPPPAKQTYGLSPCPSWWTGWRPLSPLPTCRPSWPSTSRWAATCSRRPPGPPRRRRAPCQPSSARPGRFCPWWGRGCSQPWAGGHPTELVSRQVVSVAAPPPPHRRFAVQQGCLHFIHSNWFAPAPVALPAAPAEAAAAEAAAAAAGTLTHISPPLPTRPSSLRANKLDAPLNACLQDPSPRIPSRPLPPPPPQLPRSLAATPCVRQTASKLKGGHREDAARALPAASASTCCGCMVQISLAASPTARPAPQPCP